MVFYKMDQKKYPDSPQQLGVICENAIYAASKNLDNLQKILQDGENAISCPSHEKYFPAVISKQP